jgi:uncharacterized protein (TIGR01319 family)
MSHILVTDVGSTTTKARFFQKTEEGWRFLVAGESPTTVEAPFEDVTLGVRNAVREVEELTGHRILSPDGSGIVVPQKGNVGVDLYCTTSSAGGGLQMTVLGLMKKITSESANRAALGAGAIVMDTISRDDGRRLFEKIRRIRNLRPDMILLAGGTDDGAKTQVIEIAEMVKAAQPKARLGASYELPVVYAGNTRAQSEITQILGSDFALDVVENLRPTVEIENVEPARRAIHELFMEHVMSHAPGYTKLMEWTDVDIMPTPAGEGMAMQLIASTYKTNVLGVGLGGATTNIYSIVDGRFVRSVSANLGMSYSVTNVMKETGIPNILRWLPYNIAEGDIGIRLMNKMIRPTTIPQTQEDLILEHAVAREALRLGLVHHKSIATRLKGALLKNRTISDLFEQEVAETYIKMKDIKIIVGTGGLLSHAPEEVQSMLVLIDAFQPEGITWMFKDSVFMMPHLGVLSTVHRDAAWQIFDKDCLIRLGTVIAPIGTDKIGEPVMKVTLDMPSGEKFEDDIKFGEIKRVNFPERRTAKISVTPYRKFDMGLGEGKKVDGEVMGGKVGILFDARGRPLKLAEEPDTRIKLLNTWFKSIDLYPKEDKEDNFDLNERGS